VASSDQPLCGFPGVGAVAVGLGGAHRGSFPSRLLGTDGEVGPVRA
jgi:hypothetical protein